LHRNDLPAIIKTNGTQEYYQSGLLHRSNDLPAIVRANGSKEWWINGRRHRDNGLPAIVRVNGTQEYYNNGRKPDIIWTILTFVVNLVLQMLSKLFGLLI